MKDSSLAKAFYHLPGLFEFYGLYKIFLELWQSHRTWFYPWCEIGSIYGSPSDCLWGGGRAASGDASCDDVISLMSKYKISSRLTLSNSLLTTEHLTDKKCNALCKKFSNTPVKNGVIVHSDLLTEYLRRTYPGLYLVSSTTKVLTDFKDFYAELTRKDFDFVVPDFRLNKAFDLLSSLSKEYKDKVEFLCNECCDFNCSSRKECYENVSKKNLGLDIKEHKCTSKSAEGGYRFSLAMKNPSFISVDDIKEKYLPMGFSNFKIEGRGLGSAMILEFLLYYMTKPDHQLEVREAVYLDSMLDLF
ncbi:hypothetical protein [Treponema sp.]|uniref:hypothetical protein n=1 Tax=Treponema sp. TaxID=166 RepID=UPI00298E8D9B|nr:hypothetical protein [Treponema sp.]